MAIGALVQGCVGVVGVITCGCIGLWHYDSDEDTPTPVKWTAAGLAAFSGISFILMGWCLALRY